MGNATISGSMAGSLTLLIATGLDMAAAHARLPAGIEPERVEIITRLMEAIETGRAEAESQRMAHLRETASSRT
ncbi:MAG: hypothetical protein ACXIVO_13695 [Glycocaulis sp.]